MNFVVSNLVEVAVRGPHQSWLNSDCRIDGFFGPVKLVEDLGGGETREIGVVPRVTCDLQERRQVRKDEREAD